MATKSKQSLAQKSNTVVYDLSATAYCSIGNSLIMRTLRPASRLGNAANNDLSGWILVLPAAGPFSASRRFPFVLNAGFIDSASAQKRSGRSLFSLILLPEKESTVLMEGMAATSMPSRGTQLNTHFG
jgi:hypothetical protein